MLTLKSKRIFIVEDNLTNRSVMQMLLEREGATIKFERWGVNVNEYLKNFSPVDLVVMDLMLPDGVSGFDVFDEIRKEYPALKVVAVSASDPEEAIPKAVAKGFSGFIPKPIQFTLFANQISRVLAGETVWES